MDNWHTLDGFGLLDSNNDIVGDLDKLLQRNLMIGNGSSLGLFLEISNVFFEIFEVTHPKMVAKIYNSVDFNSNWIR